jgi:hypothetical protein
MSKKHKTRLKHKHGQTISELDFTSKLSSEDCVQQLKASHSPLRGLRLVVEAEKNEFCVEWLKASNARRRHFSWTEGVWFDGTLDPQREGGTHVHGRILREFGATGLTDTAQTLVLLGPAVMLLTAALVVLGAESKDWWYAVAWAVVMVGAIAYVVLRRRYKYRLTSTLSELITERLGVERIRNDEQEASG